VKYKGTDVTVTMATTTALLTSNSAIGNIQSLTWKEDQGITQEPSGFGGRGTVGKEGIIKITGTIKRDYDETVVDSSTNYSFAQEANAFETAALTRHYIRVLINSSGIKYTFYNVIGTYTPNAGSVDGIVSEQFDFYADAIFTT
jgi:hypothetical protein